MASNNKYKSMKHQIIDGLELKKMKDDAWNERKSALHLLNAYIDYGTIEEMELFFKKFIRVHKQWLLIDDALLITKLNCSRK